MNNLKPLNFHWDVVNPFLFCAHHRDLYPAGNNAMGPAASLAGRNLGEDFTLKDGWRMYHGRTVPGFPEHPHRGFETVTIVLEGFVDHSDSHGQSGRYGMGDVQWMTAGSGLQHCEMFPLLNRDRYNPAELFQVWLNLPKARKFVDPHFKMLWSEDIPVCKLVDDAGNMAEIRVIAGRYGTLDALAPAPDSYAAMPESEVAIWLISLSPGVRCPLPPANSGTRRSLYFYKGDALVIDGKSVKSGNSFEVKAETPLILENGPSPSSLLLLQGKPIDEPVVQYGPFVMTSEAEIRATFADYRETRFGGWPWERPDQVHPREEGRFAKYRDGRVERPMVEKE